jgi:xylose isomerase
MRTYLILKEKARQFRLDTEIQGLLSEIRGQAADVTIGRYSRQQADRLKAHAFDREALAARPLPYEKLDQMVVELLLGVR